MLECHSVVSRHLEPVGRYFIYITQALVPMNTCRVHKRIKIDFFVAWALIFPFVGLIERKSWAQRPLQYDWIKKLNVSN